LVITVDCGISDVAEISWAKENGVDLIITDHHEPPAQAPPAFAVLNPKCNESKYPFRDLAGVGVALKLGQALLEAAGQGSEAWRDYLDLACLGTIADVVPIRGENRILVKHGLPALTDSRWPGMQALIEICGLKNKDIGTRQVGYALAPRLNAAGRLGTPELALELLLAENYDEALILAGRLNQANQERRSTESAVLAEALDVLEREPAKKESCVIALVSQNWHAGVIGIVAARLVDRFYRPALLISVEGEEGRGSARSIPGFNMHRALVHCREHLVGYGGHALAAGFTIKSADIEDFISTLETYAREATRGEKLRPLLEIDGLIQMDQLSEALVNEINLLRPFGHANPGPLLSCRGTELLERRGVGKGAAHLKMRLRGDNTVLDGIGFNLGAYAEVLATGEAVDLAFVPDINEYNGRRSLQLNVKDLGAPAVFAAVDAQEQDGDGIEGDCFTPALGQAESSDNLFVPEFVFTTLQKLEDGENKEQVKSKRQVRDVQLIDCRNSGSRLLRLSELAAAGEQVLVITSCGYQNIGPAYHLLQSNPSLRGKIALCHYHTSGAMKNKIFSLFQAGQIDILFATPAVVNAAGLGAGKVLLYHLPYGLESLQHTYNCVNPGGRLYFLYGPDDLQDNLDGFESLAPGREYLAVLYQQLRRQGKESYVFNINTLAKILAEAGFHYTSACTLRTAIKIFVELKLITCNNEGKILNIHFLPAPKQKKDLFQAQTFRRLTEIKKDSIRLMGDFLSEPVYNLINRDISS
ncbi:MAG: single-stranded-DNA-specific exonuclease RecJ, partial [Desulfotomaculaceae bacterium]|nr:single-stranded-DNA-specific exonuclease RecJ [Desulfotomaculaceae bacterium]